MRRIANFIAPILLLAAWGCDKETAETVIESITMLQPELTMEEGTQARLEIEITPEDADTSSIVWVSGNEDIATVDNGVVTALKEGSTKITARTDSRMAVCELTVVRPVITGVSIDRENADIRVDETITLTATVTPANVTDVIIEWSTDNASIASVTNTGVVTGISVGKALITVHAGGFSDVCEINVLPVEAESVTLSKSDLTMEEGDIEKLTATVGPANTTDKTVTWSSSDESIATVKDGTVTAVSVGKAVITAKCGNAEGTCNITVNKLTSKKYAVGDIYEADGKKGIVFQTWDNGKHGKAVSVNKAPSDYALWQSEPSFVGTSSSTDGKGNTDKIRQSEDYPDNYPAFKWFDDNYGTDWYFPSQEETAEILKNYSVVWDSSWGYDVFGMWIATSTEASENEYVFLKGNGSGGYTIAQGQKTETIAEFRAICEF